MSFFLSLRTLHISLWLYMVDNGNIFSPSNPCMSCQRDSSINTNRCVTHWSMPCKFEVGLCTFKMQQSCHFGQLLLGNLEFMHNPTFAHSPPPTFMLWFMHILLANTNVLLANFHFIENLWREETCLYSILEKNIATKFFC